MPRLLFIVIFLIFLAAAHIVILGRATTELNSLPREDEQTYQVPGPLLKITSLEFDGIASDFIFLKTLVSIGKRLEQSEQTPIKYTDWQGIYANLTVATELDPYFEDPYYLGNAYLAWEWNRIHEANILLVKGARYRTWDWRLPFFAGFNYFYFLHDNDQAGQKLMEASRRPDADPILASLASRMAYKERRTETAISFLEEVLKNTKDEVMKRNYITRIKALSNVLLLENAVSAFKKKQGRLPATLEELAAKQWVSEMPKDPYGGIYYLDRNGVVRNTKDQQLEPYKAKHRN